MNRVALKFAELRAQNRKAFIPYIMGGDPDLARTAQLINLLAAGGADLIEVGVPFSDPVADGAVIQQAGVRALSNNFTLAKLLETVREAGQNLPVPLVLMIYYNMIFQRGTRRFLEEVRQAGCAGLIIPDLPPDQGEDLRKLADEYEIGLNFLVAPTSSDERIRLAAEASTGFLYAVSLKGVTGARVNLPPELPEFIGKVKSLTYKPVAVGFGVSTPEQASMVAKLADGVIVGSAIVGAAADDPGLVKTGALVKGLRAVIC
jgi:tryptophan synthase alpha chain